jgi:hypothetical protein
MVCLTLVVCVSELSELINTAAVVADFDTSTKSDLATNLFQSMQLLG